MLEAVKMASHQRVVVALPCFKERVATTAYLSQCRLRVAQVAQENFAWLGVARQSSAQAACSTWGETLEEEGTNDNVTPDFIFQKVQTIIESTSKPLCMV